MKDIPNDTNDNLHAKTDLSYSGFIYKNGFKILSVFAIGSTLMLVVNLVDCFTDFLSIYEKFGQAGIWIMVVLFIMFVCTLLVYNFTQQNEALQTQITNLQMMSCPIPRDKNCCPLGVVKLHKKAEATLNSIIQTKQTYHFVGISSSNIMTAIWNASNKPTETLSSRSYSFVIRDFTCKNMMDRLEELRESKPSGSLQKMIETAFEHQEAFRKEKLDVTTFLAAELPDFRVAIVDDTAYISFNEWKKSSMECLQLEVKSDDSPANLYGWFHQYVKVCEENCKLRDVNIKSVFQLEVPAPDESCPFCKIVQGKATADYDKILHQTENFVVIPAKGHFQIGYCLVIPKSHFYSFSEFYNENKKEIDNIVQKLQDLSSDKFNMRPIIFEHGSVKRNKRAGNTIDHAHLHVVPVNTEISLLKQVQNDGQSVKRIEQLSSIKKSRVPYLFIRETSGECWVAEVNDKMPSQYLRMQLYRALKPASTDNLWDWTVEQHTTILKQTLEIWNLQHEERR